MRGHRAEPHLEGRVDVEAEAQRGAVGVGGAGGQLDLGGVVDHERDGPGGDRVRGEGVERPGVDARVAQQDVVDPLRDQPERLAHVVAHDAGEPGERQDAVEHVPDPDGLAGHADRRPAGPVHEVGRVGVEGVEVHDGQGRGQAPRRLVETLAEGAGHAPAPAVTGRPVCRVTPKRPARIATTTTSTIGTTNPYCSEDVLPMAPTSTPPSTAPT